MQAASVLPDAFIALSIMDPLAHQQNQYKLEAERPPSRRIDAGSNKTAPGDEPWGARQRTLSGAFQAFDWTCCDIRTVARNAKAGKDMLRPAFNVLGVVRLGPTDRAVVSL